MAVCGAGAQVQLDRWDTDGEVIAQGLLLIISKKFHLEAFILLQLDQMVVYGCGVKMEMGSWGLIHQLNVHGQLILHRILLMPQIEKIECVFQITIH